MNHSRSVGGCREGEVLTKAQFSALEKKQDGLSFTTGNTRSQGMGMRDLGTLLRKIIVKKTPPLPPWRCMEEDVLSVQLCRHVIASLDLHDLQIVFRV
jgi:hypothetical protein